MRTIGYNDVLYRAAEAAGRTRDNIPIQEAALLQSVFALELKRVWNSEAWNDLIPGILAVPLDGTKSFATPYDLSQTQITVSGATYFPNANGVYTQVPQPTAPYTALYQAANGWFITQSHLIDGDYQLQSADGTQYYTGTSLTGPWVGGDATTTSAYSGPVYPIGDLLGVWTQNPTLNVPFTRLGFYKTPTGYTVTAPERHPTELLPFPVPATVYIWYLLPWPNLLGLNATQLAATTIPEFLADFLAFSGAGHLLMADGAASLGGIQFGLAKAALDYERTRVTVPGWIKPA